MRIAGIYPQRIDIDPKIQHAVSEPYGLEMILAIAKQEGHDVHLFLPVKENKGSLVSISEDEYVDRIADFRPDVAAFSLYTCQYPMGERIATRLKRRLPGVKTIAGNRYPTHLKENMGEPFDFFVVKEGEDTFREWLHETEGDQNYGRVKGLVFRMKGKTAFTGLRPRNFDLDSLPNALRFPVISNQVYTGISLPPLSERPRYAIVEYSRCCYNNCKFCDNEGFWGNRVAFRSPQRVVEEMFQLKEMGIDIFYFMDLNFTAFPEKTLELCSEMTKQNLNAHWYCMSNIATVDGKWDILHAMKSTGCYKIAWGVESTNDNALEKMNKRVKRQLTTNNQTRRVLEKSMKAGLINQGYYIIGFPWETERSILRDAEGLRYLPLHQLNIGIFTPIPMSRFYGELEKNGLVLDPDLEKHDRNHLVYNHPTLTHSEIKALQKKIYRDFYDRPEYMERVIETCRIDPRLESAFDDYFNEFADRIVRTDVAMKKPARVA